MKEKIVGIFVCMLLIATAFLSVAGTMNVSPVDSASQVDENNPPQTTDWNPGDDYKMHYPQLPDEDGWDVYATSGLSDWPDIVLADDWRCTETGPVTDIHFWGSWYDDWVGIIYNFIIAIYTDIPANQSSTGYSMPGELQWERTFHPGEWSERVFTSPGQGWYEPFSGFYQHPDHYTYYQYNIVDIPYPFTQVAGTIYWLAITAVVQPDELPQPLWGWKSSEDHWNDDACWFDPTQGWIDLWEPQPPPITNQFWIEFDSTGIPINAGGTDYYDDGTSFNGWYYYPNTEWWNIWFYDHPFDPERYKDIYVWFDWSPTAPDYWIEVAINWATDLWPPGGPPPIPPLTPDEESDYISREFVPIYGPGIVVFYYTIPDYNPEWVSIDVRGENIAITQGTITHECLPQDQQSLDLAFVITGEKPCEPGIDVEKYVGMGDTCEYSICLYDTFGDGWDFPPYDPNNYVLLYVNGGLVGNYTQSDTDPNPISYSFTVSDGDEITTDYVARGSYPSENEYYILDCRGNEVRREGAGSIPGDILPGELYATTWADADTEDDAIDIPICTNVTFLITIHNNGTCCDLTNIYVYDFMEDSLEFIDADPYPDYIELVANGTHMEWHFPGPLSPCNWINITITAHVVGPACSIDENYVYVDGYCEATDAYVWDEDSAFVHPVEPCKPGIDVEKYVWVADPPCDYTICLEDSYGDGWNGGYLDVYVNGAPVYANLTIIDGYGPECYLIRVMDTDEIFVDYTYGSYPSENIWYLLDCAGNQVAYQTGGYDNDLYDFTVTADIGTWVDADTEADAIDIPICTEVEFLITIHNNGTCCDLTNIYVYDFMEDSMEFISADPPPDLVEPVPGGTALYWYFPDPLPPCNWINITITAHVIGPACYIDENHVMVEAYCETTDKYVYDEDSAFVHPVEPCKPGIDIEKYVWDEANADWVDADTEADAIDIPICTEVEFLITIHNNGTCCDLTNIYVYDFMEDSMEFISADPPPDLVEPVPGGTALYWYFPDPLPPCNWINITITAHVIGPACYIDENHVMVEAYCETTDKYVYDEDSAFVHATEPEWPDHKMHYPQLPDPNGWDVVATMAGITVADDWRCSESGPVTDIHFWGSWLTDMVGVIQGFWVSIHADIPAPPYSRPGEELWSAYITDFEIVQETDGYQGWYDPYEPWWEYPDHQMYFRYDITNITDPFYQENGTIYWLNIIADLGPPGYPEPPLWGWKTSLNHWNDDAVWSIFDPPFYEWFGLYDPITGLSLDMSFVITGKVQVLCGDVTNNGVIDIGDVVYLINYLYRGGPPPIPMTCVGDVTCNGVVDIGDVVYLINYLYRSGPPPCPDCCNPPW